MVAYGLKLGDEQSEDFGGVRMGLGDGGMEAGSGIADAKGHTSHRQSMSRAASGMLAGEVLEELYLIRPRG